MTQGRFLQELFSAVTERGRRWFEPAAEPAVRDEDMEALCRDLLSSLGEATGVALAHRILLAYEARDADGRTAFLKVLNARFGLDPDKVLAAAQAYRDDPSLPKLKALFAASEPPRQELLRRLNLAPQGTRRLVRMREDLLTRLRETPELEAVDIDFAHLFQSWFNRGFLVLRRIDWQTPAAILEKIIRYEAVHAIRDWDDLRRRIDMPDRRLYAFFHPALADEPLIFVEVALTDFVPGAIEPLLDEERVAMPAERATTAVFYSISNAQAGLRGVSFGNFLLKQVVQELSAELGRLSTFLTLSPLPGFRRWLGGLDDEALAALAPGVEPDVLAEIRRFDWLHDPARTEALKAPVLGLAAAYLLEARNAAGQPVDPVARFHLGNGARLERVNWLANQSERGLRESAGIMVNYLYDLLYIVPNHEAFARQGTVAASRQVRALLAPLRSTRRGARAPHRPSPEAAGAGS